MVFVWDRKSVDVFGDKYFGRGCDPRSSYFFFFFQFSYIKSTVPALNISFTSTTSHTNYS